MAAADRRIRHVRHQALTAPLIACALLFALPASARPGPLRYPLDYPPRVSATFGTYRIGHHHAGMDLTTDGDQTVAVLASAAGKIVRIRRNDVGFGRAIYIAHPDKRMTVYAHLAAFDPRLHEAVRAAEARSGGFKFDHRLRDPIAVEAGDRLGWIGTSGTDLLHLHYEVRRGGQPVNPLTDGLEIPDTRAPVIRRLLAIPRAPDAHVDHRLDERTLTFSGGTLPAPVVLGGDVQLFVEAVDFIDGMSRAVTPYSVELRIDGRRWHRSRYVRVSYRDKGHTELDFEPGRRARGEGMFHKLVADPLGPDVRAHAPAGKPLTALAPGLHPAEIIVRDAAGNVARANFRLDVRPLDPPCAPKRKRLRGGTRAAGEDVLLRDRLLAVPTPGLCTDAARYDLTVDGKRTRARTTRLGDTPALALEVAPDATTAIDLRVAGPDGITAWQLDTLSGPPDKPIALGPVQLTIGREARFWPYPTRFIGTRDNPGAPGLDVISPLYRFANGWVPTKGGSTIGLRLPPSAPATSAMYFHEDGRWWWMGRGRRGPWMRGWTVHFGEIAIMADSEPPLIGVPRLEDHPAGPRLIVPIEDEGSGIRTARLTVDGEPVLAERQRAWGRLVWLPLAPLPPGDHRIDVTVTDRVGHSISGGATVTWPAPPTPAAPSIPAPPTPPDPPPTEATPRDGIGDGAR